MTPSQESVASGGSECPRHGNYAPARFCCACTREPIKRERDRYRQALEQIASGILPDGDIPNMSTMMYVERVLGDAASGAYWCRGCAASRNGPVCPACECETDLA